MRKLIILLTAFLIINNLAAQSAEKDSINKKVKLLLIGDSTTEGGKPTFENTIEQLLAREEGIPNVEAINVGKGGETAFSLLNSGRYDSQVKGIDSIDYIFLRYGINDWFKRQPFEENFPKDMKNVIAQLRNDYPESQIIVMTILPFLREDDTKIVNQFITNVASEEKLEIFDICPAYQKGLEEYGEFSMSVRFFPLSDIPEKYHTLVAPYTKYYEWKKAEWLRVYTNELDPLFGHLPGWYKDKHPNPTGYRLIARETVEFILPKLKNK
ncbi:SGNH/GDSL hydrolase family protein [Carboxylicivirga sp. M1479]|uniref:SGNH/GDSL hydrolase family protein n=1 Tax=Carboxylicivirga sp. M1479 TaxID=2594476 RepID=UPI001177EFC2|nr:SGNH/GDSL hydrolase family protein [Carboxylicivirga sp. M1479]TRX70384.1 SGNH/GDSL hydrolase family protein [Carboxylicivirga sp. M1479]